MNVKHCVQFGRIVVEDNNDNDNDYDNDDEVVSMLFDFVRERWVSEAETVECIDAMADPVAELFYRKEMEHEWKKWSKKKDVKAVITSYLELTASELKKNGVFKFGGCLNLKLKTKPARPAREGVNPFTKELCVFNAKPVSKTIRALATKKFKEMINRTD